MRGQPLPLDFRDRAGAGRLSQRVEDRDVVKRFAIVLHERSTAFHRCDEVRYFVTEIPDNPAVDLRPQVGVATNGPVVINLVVALVGAIEEGARAGSNYFQARL